MGMEKFEVAEAYSGDIVSVAGLPDIHVGETITEVGFEDALPHLHIDEPTVQMTMLTNTSPFAGKEGKHVTASKIDERLFKETQKDECQDLLRKAFRTALWKLHFRFRYLICTIPAIVFSQYQDFSRHLGT
jgi:GTP-binding protein